MRLTGFGPRSVPWGFPIETAVGYHNQSYPAVIVRRLPTGCYNLHYTPHASDSVDQLTSPARPCHQTVMFYRDISNASSFNQHTLTGT